MLDFKSPAAILLAWLVVPALIVVAAGGLGLLVARIAGVRLGALTLPAGFAGGIVAYTFALQAGADAIVCSVMTAALVVVGYAWSVLAARQTTASGDPRQALGPGTAALASAALAFLIAMAPLVGTGRIGVLGYIQLNDPAWHIALIEWIHEFGPHTSKVIDSSFASVSAQIDAGYPLGTYAWSLFSIDFTGADGIAIWTPIIAVTLAMIAAAACGVIERMGVARRVAVPVAAIVAVGYLPLSYLAQGGSKEVLFSFTLFFTAAALTTVSLERDDSLVRSARRLAPAITGSAAMVFVFGPGAVIWLVPLAAGFVGILVIAPPSAASRGRIALLAVATSLIAIVVAIPAIIAVTRVLGTVTSVSGDPSQIGNLLGAVPIGEVFNSWISEDYRQAVPHAGFGPWTYAATTVAAGFALAGVWHELRERRLFVPIAGAAGVVAVLFIGLRYNIYFVAKAYVAVAPVIACATVGGIVWLWRAQGRRRFCANLAAGFLLLTVLISTGAIYRSVFTTPSGRFQELSQLNERFRGQGPTLVLEREEYAQLLLRDLKPWEEYGMFAPSRGLAADGGGGPSHAPETDDYEMNHLQTFPLLIVRKQPGGSLPPSNYKLVDQTKHYNVWHRKSGSDKGSGTVIAHVAIGRFNETGTGTLECAAPEVLRAIATARSEGLPVQVAVGKARPVIVPIASFKQSPAPWTPVGPDNFVQRTHRDQSASAVVKLKAGHTYDVFQQGSWGSGLSLWHGGVALGSVKQDFGQRDQWQPFSAFTASGSDELRIRSLKAPLWQAGSARGDLVGSLALVDRGVRERIEQVSVTGLKKLCGKDVDWIEVRR